MKKKLKRIFPMDNLYRKYIFGILKKIIYNRGRIENYLKIQGFKLNANGDYERKIETTTVFTQDFLNHLDMKNELTIKKIKGILSYIKVNHYDYNEFIKTRKDEIKEKTKNDR